MPGAGSSIGLVRGKATSPAVVGGPPAVASRGRAGRLASKVGGNQGRADVSALFGSVEVVVPDGTRVDKGGLVLFGSVECEDACRGSGPVIAVRSLGAFGSVTILTQSEADREADDG
jgi:hypothetical protein